MLDIHEVTFEIYIDGKLTQRQALSAPKEFLIINFLQTAQQMQNDPRPITIKMIRPMTIWNEFEQKQMTLNNEIVLSNAAATAKESAKED